MLADDAYRDRLHSMIRSVREWLRPLGEVAAIEEVEMSDYWHLRLLPSSVAACPIEVIVYSSQHYDVAVGPETFEGLPLEDVSRIRGLLAAVVDGQIEIRTWSTRATGTTYEVETIIGVDGERWQAGRKPGELAGNVSRADCSASTRRYAPYRLASRAA